MATAEKGRRMTTEEWREIPGYGGRYLASNLGRIKRIRTAYCSHIRGNPVKRWMPEKILGGTKLGTKGYKRVNLGTTGKNDNRQIHVLIALCWISNIGNKQQINHVNGVKTDNRIENLEWVTNQENRDHAVRLGLNASRKQGSLGKLSVAQVDAALVLWDSGYYKQAQIARLFDVCQQTISKLHVNRE